MLETVVFLFVLGGVTTLLQKRAAKKAGLPWSKFYKMTPEEKRKAGIKI